MSYMLKYRSRKYIEIKCFYSRLW